MIRKLLSPVLALLAVAAPVRAQLPATPEARMAAVERNVQRAVQVAGRAPERWTVEERLTDYGVPAVSVAVIHDGRVDWAHAWGLADVESKRPATAATLFQAASMSKAVAALGALTMVEDGMLSLDADVNDALVAWKVPQNRFTAEHAVTLRELLSHTAGVNVHGFPGYAADETVPSVIGVLNGVGNTDAIVVDTVPGSIWRYSGGGYTIAQELMTERAGEPFAELMRERVLEPLGMTESTYRQPLPESLRDRAATGYREGGAPIEGLYHTYPEMAAAGLWTTAADYARFIIGIQRAYAGAPDAIVSRETATAMLTPVMSGYGLGVGSEDAGDSLRFTHSGANEGFRSVFTAYVGRGEGIVVLTNGDTGSGLTQEIALAAAEVYGWPGLRPRVIVPVAVDPATLEELTGGYAVQDTRLDVTRQGDRLFLAEDGGAALELIPTAADTFVYTGRGITLTFERGAGGEVTGIRAGRAWAPRVR